MPAAPNVARNGTLTEDKPAVAVGAGHTGEEVLVAAEGPGSDKVHGIMSNTDLFRVMMSAYGWKVDPQWAERRRV